MKCCACFREQGTLQRLGENVSFLVCSADLGESDMSCLDLLLKIFVLDVEMLAQFCHAVGVCDIDASLVGDAQGKVPMRSTCFPSMISRCGLSSIRRAAVLNGTFHEQLSFWNQVRSRAATLAATSSASVHEWAMVGCFDEM
jgi:hypothetical protein